MTQIKDNILNNIPDTQSRKDTRHIAINRVGIKDIKHPVVVSDRSGRQQRTVANFNMYVNLPHNFKGTHMSRFVEILNQHEYEITVKSFKKMLTEMTALLNAQEGHIEMNFPYFCKKVAPVSGVHSLMDYQVYFIGESINQNTSVLVKVIIPVTTLCPCSKSISDYGAHNQRSHITVLVKTKGFIWIEDMIDIVEKMGSCELYSLLKRADEKYVTEKAYDNPKFVEDIVRDIAIEFNKNEQILSYVIESENFESIHNHSAYAMIEHTKEK